LFEISTTGKPTTETNDLIDEAIAAFDVLITKVNAKNVENKKAHFKQINVELEQTANQLIAQRIVIKKNDKKIEIYFVKRIHLYICTRNETPA
jgi:glucan phosphorylase